MVARFNTVPHSVKDMAIMVIDKIYHQDPTLLKLMEARWIRTLGTSIPHGMNLRVDNL